MKSCGDGETENEFNKPRTMLLYLSSPVIFPLAIESMLFLTLQGLYDDDYFADILKDDIIMLDESSESVPDNKPVVANNSEAHQELMEPVSQSIPFQGTANRRIRLRRGKLKSQAPLEGTTSEQSPKGLANSHLLIYVFLCVFVLLVLFLSNFCFPRISSSVSLYAGRFLASENIND